MKLWYFRVDLYSATVYHPRVPSSPLPLFFLSLPFLFGYSDTHSAASRPTRHEVLLTAAAASSSFLTLRCATPKLHCLHIYTAVFITVAPQCLYSRSHAPIHKRTAEIQSALHGVFSLKTKVKACLISDSRLFLLIA